MIQAAGVVVGGGETTGAEEIGAKFTHGGVS
jgi:hypothetical protein